MQWHLCQETPTVMIYPPNPVPAFKLEGKLEGKAWQSSGRAWQMGKSQSVARSCQLLPSAISRLSSTNLRSLCQIRQKRSQRTLCITMSCPFLHSKMNHFSPPASTQIAQTVLLKVWKLVVSRCFEDNVDKFLTTDVTKPKASKVPFSWHTNRHTESIESIVFFLGNRLSFSRTRSRCPSFGRWLSDSLPIPKGTSNKWERVEQWKRFGFQWEANRGH